MEKPLINVRFMLNVRVFMTVRFHEGLREFWRDTKMPALPPVGCVFSSDSIEDDCVDVVKIWYIEELQLFVVELEDYDIRTQIHMHDDFFISKGWKQNSAANWIMTPFSEEV